MEECLKAEPANHGAAPGRIYNACEVILLSQAQCLNRRLVNCRRDRKPVVSLVIRDCRTRVRAKNAIDRTVVITFVVQLYLDVCDDFVRRQIVVAVDGAVVRIIGV